MISDKSILIAICCGFCLTACNGNLQDNALSKLENLYCVRPDSVMDYYDLSGDSLKEFPDLSMYVIHSLDLSHNQLDTFVPERLPLGLERLDMSHNRLKGELEVKKGSMPTLVELDLSYNRLLGIFIHESNLRRLILAHNNLCRNIAVTGKALRYLDLSYNRLLEPRRETFPHETDTILWEGTPPGEGKAPSPPALRSTYRFPAPAKAKKE